MALSAKNKKLLNDMRPAVEIALAQKDYGFYVEYTHRPAGIVDSRWVRAKHLDYICNQVQSFIETDTGHAFDIMILSMPPQHGKSMSITETLPSWYVGKWPDNNVVMASYNDDTAERFMRRNKDKIRQYGNKVFNIQIGDIDRATEFELSGHYGRVISRGIMGGITSNPAHLVLIDDPVKNRQEADSDTYRDRQWDEWLNSIKTRLAAKAKIIIIMTRWHEDDLAGRIIANEKNVTVINLPCEAEENDPLGRKVGDALFPEIGKDNKWLAEFKAGYQSAEGSRAWGALFQGHPTYGEGGLVKRSWWQYYDDLPVMMQELISVDATFKDGDNNDFVAIQCWGKRNADMYLIDLIKAHLDFPSTLKAIMDMKSRRPKCRMILIEDKANGSAAIQMLRRQISGVIAVNPEGGKVARVNAISPTIESGNVYIPRKASYTADFVDEFTSFPHGKHDDQVDCCSQALNRFIYYSASVPGAPAGKSIFEVFNIKQDRNDVGKERIVAM